MAYTTHLHVTRECSSDQLCRLVRSLQKFDCVVRLEPAPGEHRADLIRLEVWVPADGYTWIVTGGFGALVGAYGDAVRWRTPFAEFPDHGGHAAPLPAASAAPEPRR